MFPTVEVRWFYRGKIPTHIHAWFARLAGPAMDQAQRTDVYLDAGRVDLGIKLREGQIELKQRQQADGFIHLMDQTTGEIERWRKWSFSLAAGCGVNGTGWTAVTKTRRLRSYYLARNGAILPLPVGQRVARGCEVELTQVEACDEAWWTVAIEAFGEGDAQVQVLRLVGHYVFGVGVGHVFSASDSCSYPAWLARLVEEE